MRIDACRAWPAVSPAASSSYLLRVFACADGGRNEDNVTLDESGTDFSFMYTGYDDMEEEEYPR